MNVLLISQCDKRALTETRRILDQFAERRGDRTWQTPITQDGLDTLRGLLRKSARKNTAVACHWIRGLDHSELLWVVGDRRRFNAEGTVPTNTTQRNVLRSRDENDWHTGEDILLLTTLAALLHDIGKAIDQFQQRLRTPDMQGRHQYRHEWVSLRLFQAFVGQDDDATWLRRLAEPTPEDDSTWLDRLQRDGLDIQCDRPFAHLPPLAQAVGWLVVTHHRLPVMPGGRWLGDKVREPAFRPEHLQGVLNTVGADWNEAVTTADKAVIEPYWSFARGLPVTNETWRKKTARIAKRLLALNARPDRGNWVSNPYVMHVARLALMLADHHYSSLTRPDDPRRLKVDSNGKLFANTRFDQPHQRVLNQTLEEHLVGVASHAGAICHALSRFEHHLPRLAHHKPLKRRSTDPRFRWQDKAAELAAGMRDASSTGGGFIVNMASTGCGKTLANARVMYALADPVLGMRCVFALGLRTLTLQTGKAFREAAALSDDDVAVRVGGAATRALFEYHEQLAEASGSASSEPLLPDNSTVRYEGATDGHPLLDKALEDPAVRKLLLAPVLVCTIDHMTPATECQRGGRQIAPMLRLMSSDLVIDELDDFDIDDLPAVARLVHWAGLLGARVLLSSATLPPALVQGMFEAYREGRAHHARNRGATPGAVHAVACAWIDEFDQQRADCADGAAFAQAHLAFATQRAQTLGAAVVRRRAELRPLTLAGADVPAMRHQFAQEVLDAARHLHACHHQVDPHTGHRVSFGLVRMANIGPLYDVALALYGLGVPAGVRIHLCTYHSQYPLLLRSGIERLLDHVLDRRDPAAIFQHPEVRLRLAKTDEPDQLFVVLGSPVTEVGRDHDYDWAVVEPSSMRSLIQLAGRVWRHRPALTCDAPNIAVFGTNLKCWERPGQPAYCQPGFESHHHLLARHRLGDLLRDAEWQRIDSRPRILPRPAAQWQPDRSLVDLEHRRLSDNMLAPSTSNAPRRRGAPPAVPALGAFTWWRMPPQDALLTAALPQQQPFRAEHERQVDLCLLPDDDTASGYALHAVGKPERRRPAPMVRIDRSKHHAVPAAHVTGERISPWGETNYLAALEALAEGMDMPVDECARRFGTVTLPQSETGWRFHPALGFAKAR